MEEQAKYEKLWGEVESYRTVAPGEAWSDRFIRKCKPNKRHTIIEFGAGTGRGALRIHEKTGAAVRMLDFAENCLDAAVRAKLSDRFTFERHDLTHPVPVEKPADFGFCTDVMEHIPPEDVVKVLQNIGLAARRVYFVICLQDDVSGWAIGEKLHLTVEDAYWWHDTLLRAGYRIDSSAHNKFYATFTASMYLDAKQMAEHSALSIEEEQAKRNIVANLRMGLKEVAPHEVQKDTHLILLAGGPSLVDHEDEIIEAGRRGVPIITMNGTYDWLLQRGIKPAGFFMVDGQEWNARFITKIVDNCKYFFNSQVSPKVVSLVPKEQAWLFHSGDNETTEAAFREFCEEKGATHERFPVGGGTTVVSRALTCLIMLGFRNVEIFGWDSCLRGDKHHAYDQPENDSETVVDVTLGDRTFKCHTWMAMQAHEVRDMVAQMYGRIEDLNICVRGDGLIAHIFNHAATLAMEVEDGCK